MKVCTKKGSHDLLPCHYGATNTIRDRNKVKSIMQIYIGEDCGPLLLFHCWQHITVYSVKDMTEVNVSATKLAKSWHSAHSYRIVHKSPNYITLLLVNPLRCSDSEEAVLPKKAHSITSLPSHKVQSQYHSRLLNLKVITNTFLPHHWIYEEDLMYSNVIYGRQDSWRWLF